MKSAIDQGRREWRMAVIMLYSVPSERIMLPEYLARIRSWGCTCDYIGGYLGMLEISYNTTTNSMNTLKKKVH